MNNKVKKILIISIIIVIAVITLFIIMFFWQGEEKKPEMKTEFTNYEEIMAENKKTIDQAINEKNPSLCDNLDLQGQIFNCKIDVSAAIGNFNFCNQEFEENMVFHMTMKTNKEYSFDLDAQDNCWMKISMAKGAEYCDNIKNKEAKIACKDFITFYKIK